MKTHVLVILVFTFFATSSFAQSFEGKGDVYWNFGIGVFDKIGHGGYFNYLTANNGTKINLPTFTTSLDFGIHRYVTIGGFLAVHHRSFHYSDPNNAIGVDNLRSSTGWHVAETWWNFGGRGMFMISNLLRDETSINLPDQLDFYAGLLAGVSVYHKKRHDDMRGASYPYTLSAGTLTFMAIGGRWMFNDAFGAYFEVYPVGVSSNDSFDYLSTISTGFNLKF